MLLEAVIDCQERMAKKFDFELKEDRGPAIATPGGMVTPPPWARLAAPASAMASQGKSEIAHQPGEAMEPGPDPCEAA